MHGPCTVQGWSGIPCPPRRCPPSSQPSGRRGLSDPSSAYRRAKAHPPPSASLSPWTWRYGEGAYTVSQWLLGGASRTEASYGMHCGARPELGPRAQRAAVREREGTSGQRWPCQCQDERVDQLSNMVESFASASASALPWQQAAFPRRPKPANCLPTERCWMFRVRHFRTRACPAEHTVTLLCKRARLAKSQ